MAEIKDNVVKFTKAMFLLLMGNGKCFNCEHPIEFIGKFEVGHIIARKFVNDNKITNLVPLCSPCNKAIGTKSVLEVVTESKRNYLESFTEKVNRLDNPNDIRNVMNLSLKGYFGNVLDKANVTKACDTFAKQYPHSRYARTHKNGMYAK